MSYSRTSILAVATTLLARVSAHGYVSGIVADGAYYQGYNPSFQYAQNPPAVAGWSDPENLGNGFVADYASPDIICHLGATPGQAYATVAADTDKTALKFNKIDEAGRIHSSAAPGVWASDEMIANNNTWVTTIPSTIAPGKYVLRHENIALHSAGEVGGAQAYPQCVNLEVTGSGSDGLSEGTLGTALYTAEDPGLVYNIYQVDSEYPIPGPALMAGAGGSDGRNTPSTTASASASATGTFGNSTVTSIPTTLQTATRSATGTLIISSSVSTNIAIASSTAATTSVTASITASATSSAVITTLPGSTGTPKKFVCYEVEE